MDNVTQRNRLLKANSYDESLNMTPSEESLTRSQIFDASMKSLPTIDMDSSLVTLLKAQVDELRLQVDAANSQIDELLLENSGLKKALKDANTRNELLKKISLDPTSSKKLRKKITAKNKDITPETLSCPPSESNSPKVHETPKSSTRSHKRRTLIFNETSADDQKISSIANELPPKPYATINCKDNNIRQDSNSSPMNGNNSTNPDVLEVTTATTNGDPPNGNKILLFGTQQCVGMASVLLEQRESSRYHKYSIMASTKPNATTEEVLKECYKVTVGDSDKIILCVGENDHNPKKIVSDLSVILNKFKSCVVIVLNVNTNRYLNESMLNSELQLLCKMYPNCYFVKSNLRHNITCYKLNCLIDFIDYERDYLDLNKLKKHINSHNCNGNGNENSRIMRKHKSGRSKLVQKCIIDYFLPLSNKKTDSTEIKEDKMTFFLV